MSAVVEPRPFRAAGFRTRLLAAMMVVVVAIAALALYLAERRLVADVEGDLNREFQLEIEHWRKLQDLRKALLAERVRVLIHRPRLQEALRPEHIDVLYKTAHDEMKDVMVTPAEPSDPETAGLHAEFYRFLDRAGRVIPIPTDDVLSFGHLQPEEERQLALPEVSRTQQVGYLVRTGSSADTLAEIISIPFLDNDEVVGTLVLGFETLFPRRDRLTGSFADHSDSGPEYVGIMRGLWREGTTRGDERVLFAPGVPESIRGVIATDMTFLIATGQPEESSFRNDVGGTPHLLFYKRLNPGSLYAPAYEVSVYPLADLRARQQRLRWQVAGAGALLLLGAFGASHFLSGRLAGPVVELADASALDRAQRQQAEVALELSHEELQRAARFSADASHQLKTPVAVLRAGLEEILHRETLTPRETEEVAALIHQTYRLSGIIEDLLLLSRIDAGRLALELVPMSLTELIEAALDDVGVAPGAEGVKVETDLPAELRVLGDKRYLALVLQNLLENAWKYNRPGGTIRLSARVEGEEVELRVANTGKPIPAAAQERIFERFHRGGVGENVPGYGLGLNLARELARLHGGHLRLARSDENWTEFELRLRRAA